MAHMHMSGDCEHGTHSTHSVRGHVQSLGSCHFRCAGPVSQQRRARRTFTQGSPRTPLLMPYTPGSRARGPLSESPLPLLVRYATLWERRSPTTRFIPLYACTASASGQLYLAVKTLNSVGMWEPTPGSSECRYSSGDCWPSRNPTVSAPRLGELATLLKPGCGSATVQRPSGTCHMRAQRTMGCQPGALASRKFVKNANLPDRVTPSHVPPPCKSLPARISGLSSQKCASFVGL